MHGLEREKKEEGGGKRRREQRQVAARLAAGARRRRQHGEARALVQLHGRSSWMAGWMDKRKDSSAAGRNGNVDNVHTMGSSRWGFLVWNVDCFNGCSDE